MHEVFSGQAMQVLIGGLVTAIFVWATQYFQNRGLRTTTENLRLATELAEAQRLANMRQAERQADSVEKIATLAVQTHEAVNSGRTRLEEAMRALQDKSALDMAALRAQSERDIAALRQELKVAQLSEASSAAAAAATATALATLAPAPAPIPPQDAQVTIPAVTVAVEAAEPPRIVRP